MVQATSQHTYSLFQRAGSSKWWMRFSIRGEAFRAVADEFITHLQLDVAAHNDERPDAQ
jgi:hypothetical protein